MKDAPIGSCWQYTNDDTSMYADQYYVITRSHRDALGDYEYEGWMSPLNRNFEISDVILGRYFRCISLPEPNKVSA